MTKPVTGLTQWGATTTGSTGDLDDNFTSITTALNDLNTYSNYFSDTGAVNAYVVTLAANLTATLTAGLKISVRIANSSTSSTPTLNFNGTGALPIRQLNNVAGAPVSLQAGGVYDFILNSDASAWILQTPFQTGPTLIAIVATANTTSVEFNNTLSDSFGAYTIVIDSARVETDAASLVVQVGNGNAGTYVGANYSWSAEERNSAASSIAQGSDANSFATAIVVAANVGNGSVENFGGEILITRRIGSATYAPMTSRLCYANTAGNATTYTCGGFWQGSVAITSIRVLASAGNIVTGRFYLYGYPSG